VLAVLAAPVVLQGVLYGLTRGGRVLIADEMGVGKTVQALALAACYQVKPQHTGACRAVSTSTATGIHTHVRLGLGLHVV